MVFKVAVGVLIAGFAFVVFVGILGQLWLPYFWPDSDHWWVVRVAAWMQLTGLVVFGAAFLYVKVLGPLYDRLTSRGDNDSALSIEETRRRMIERGELTGRSVYRETRRTLGPKGPP